MNLFILDLDPKLNAEYHCDSHCVKMILEGMQLICTTFHVRGITAPYKKTHVNHPCAVFARQSRQNFDFVVDYVCALSSEYTYRYNKIHKSSLLLDWVDSHRNELIFPCNEPTKFAQAMPEKYRNESVVEAYRAYYNGEKQHLFKWTKRVKPYWLK